MGSSYIRICCSLDDAMARYGRWVGTLELALPRLAPERESIDAP